MPDISTLSDKELEQIANQDEQNTVSTETQQINNSNLSEISDEELEKIANQQQESIVDSRTQLQQTIPEVPSFLTDSIVAPMVEVSRGLYRSAGSFYGKIAGISKLIEKGTGLRTGGIFEDWSNSLKTQAENLPNTGITPVAKTIYEMIGGTVPTITEFATVAKVPGLSGVSSVSQVGQFALLQALDEFNNNPELKSIAKGFAEGAISGMTVLGGFNLGKRAIDLLYRGGKQIAKAYLTFVTGDKKIGERFIKDPNSYNLRLKDKVLNVEEVKTKNKIKLDEIKTKYDNEKLLFNDNLKREQEILDMKLKDAEISIRETNNSLKQDFQTQNALTVDEAAQQAAKSIEQSQQALQEKAINIYDNALAKYKLIKQESGERVENAIEGVIEKDPLVGLPGSFVKKKVDSLIKKEIPFAKSGKTFTTRTAAGNKQEVNIFNNIIDEFDKRVADEDLTLGYLQYLKKDLQELSNKYYTSGSNELGKFYADFHRKINPVMLVDDFARTAPSVSRSLQELASANKSFTELMPKYERAMDKYFEKNVRNEYIPNPSKALSAIAKNDISKIREMKIADMALPKDDQIFPQLEKLVNETRTVENNHKSIIKSLKKKAQNENMVLSNAARKSIQELQKKQHLLRNEEKTKITNLIRSFNSNKDAEYTEIINMLNAEEGFFKQQDILRQFSASSKTGASLLQHILGFGGVAAIKYGNIPSGVSSLGATVMLSPNIAAKSARNVLTQQENAKSILSPILERRMLQQLVGTKAEQQ